MKYSQKRIPSITTPQSWKDADTKTLRTLVKQFYTSNIQGKEIRNLHTGLLVRFTDSGKAKTAKGGTLAIDKATVVMVLLELMEVAEFNNFGQPKPTDVSTLLYYANFKAKVMVNGATKHIRLSTRLIERQGCMHYSLEINRY